MMKFNGLRWMTLFAAVSCGAVAATAQVTGNSDLNLPANPQFLSNEDPTIRKATAIVNGDVITATDIDQRLALYMIANQGTQIPPDEMQRIRQQILRNLVDETLQIQAAAAADIKIDQKEIDSYFDQYAHSIGRDPKTFPVWLRQHGTSEKSIKRQIHGELSWRRLQGREIEPFVNVSDEEVKAMISRLNATKGSREYKVAEIFLSAPTETASEVRTGAQRIVDQIRNGASFIAYARQFSEASTAAQGGDLGWLQPERLPAELASAVKTLPIGQVSDPIPVQGGYSILLVQDSRQVLMSDARDSVLSLKQLTLTFPKGATEKDAAAKLDEFVRATQSMGGCGGAEAAATKLGAELVSNDQNRVRDLPPALQQMLLSMSIGQATKPFGSLQEGVRVLVLCGRDDPPPAGAPSFDQIYAQIEEQRVNMRAQRYLRDLRRDAVVEYR
jgi:peptidyl-prolyl cis-trans isomerase SurA